MIPGIMYQIRICRRESEAAVKRSDLANFDPDTPLEKLGWARTLRGSILVLDSCVFFRQVPEESSIVLVVVPVEKKRAVNGWFVSLLLSKCVLAATNARIVQHHAPGQGRQEHPRLRHPLLQKREHAHDRC